MKTSMSSMSDRDFEHALEKHFDEMHEDAFGDDVPPEEPDYDGDYDEREPEIDEFAGRAGVQF